MVWATLLTHEISSVMNGIEGCRFHDPSTGRKSRPSSNIHLFLTNTIKGIEAVDQARPAFLFGQHQGKRCVNQRAITLQGDVWTAGKVKLFGRASVKVKNGMERIADRGGT